MMMPGMSGMDLARAIAGDRQLAPTKMILLTSISCRGDQSDAKSAGISVYLQKPVQRAQLQGALASLLPGGPAPAVPARAPAADSTRIEAAPAWTTA